jgi:hypothetical protein
VWVKNFFFEVTTSFVSFSFKTLKNKFQKYFFQCKFSRSTSMWAWVTLER